jgi:DNA repair protein RadA/Sms
VQPTVVVVDSVQTVADPELAGAPGGVGQVREVAAQLVRLAKERSIATFLVGQVTKEGAVAGPKTLEHLVDVVLNFEGDQHHALRLVRCTKNRFGPAYEVGCFEMTEAGLEPLADPLAAVPVGPLGRGAGVACTVSLEGRRPLVTEVQALVVPTGVAVPRRTAQGLDAGRLAILVAVLDRRARIGLAGQRRASPPPPAGSGSPSPRPTWPSASPWPRPPATGRSPSDLITIGEVGLGGEVRPVPQLPRRLAEAARLGFRRALVPGHRPPRQRQDRRRRDRPRPGRLGRRVPVRPGHRPARRPAPAEAGGRCPG